MISKPITLCFAICVIALIWLLGFSVALEDWRWSLPELWRLATSPYTARHLPVVAERARTDLGLLVCISALSAFGAWVVVSIARRK